MNIINNRIPKNKFILLIIIFFIISYIILDNYSTENQFAFSNVINPYNPLEKKKLNLPQKVLNSQDYWQDPRGLFPIFAFNLPEKSNDLTSSLKVIEKGGINIIINGNMGWMPEPFKIKSAFEKLQNSNLKWLAIIENECKDDFIFRNTNNETIINIKKYLSEFNEDYVYGWYVWDEPGLNKKLCSILPESNDDYEDINTITKQIRSDYLFSDKLDFVNLYPTYWQRFDSSIDYEKYIDAFFSSQEYKPRLLCFDHYPFLKNEKGGFRQDFYSNLSIIRKKSLEYNVPFWMIVQTSEHLAYRKPLYADISLQVYSALAYGAKGIGYYLYSKCWEHVTYKSWILENYVENPNVADSLHGPLFVPIKKLNQNIQSLGKVLTNLESVEIIHTSDYPNKQKDISKALFKKNQTNSIIKEILDNEDSNTDSTILVGVFTNKIDSTSSRKYLLIVNKDVRANSSSTILLNKYYSLFKFDNQTGDSSLIDYSDKISLKLSPGSGELYYIE